MFCCPFQIPPPDQLLGYCDRCETAEVKKTTLVDLNKFGTNAFIDHLLLSNSKHDEYVSANSEVRIRFL